MARVGSQAINQLTKELEELRKSSESQHKTFKGFMRMFGYFTKNSQNFFNSFKAGGANPPGGGSGGGGGGGTGGGPGNQPPGDNDDTSKGRAAVFGRYTNQLIGTVRSIDELQARFMASNTKLSDQVIPDLGIRFSKLASEILDLREIGFKNLDMSTMKLMTTMKITGQSTASLKEFLAKTSLSILANNTEIQNLSINLEKTARAYGTTQEALFRMANTLSESIKTASLFGKGQQTLEAFSELGASLGERAIEPLKVAADFLTGIGKESEAMMAGVFDIQNKFLTSSKEEQVKLTYESIRVFNERFKAMTRGLTGSAADKRQLEVIANMFGGMDVVAAYRQLEVSIKEGSKKTDVNNQELALLRSAEEQYADSIERSAVALEKIVEKIPRGALQTAGSITGGLATAAAGLGVPFIAKTLLKRVGAGALAGSIGGPLGMIAGGLFAITGLMSAGNEILGMIKGSSKNTSDNTARIPDPTKTDSTSQRQTTLLDVLGGMVRSLQPQTDTQTKETAEAQKQAVMLLGQINNNLSNIGRMERPAGMALQR